MVMVQSLSKEARMMVSNERQRVYPIGSKEKISPVSRFFRILVRFNAFPLKADFEKRHLSFAFFSCRTFIFIFICIVVLALPQVGQGRFPGNSGLYIFIYVLFTRSKPILVFKPRYKKAFPGTSI